MVISYAKYNKLLEEVGLNSSIVSEITGIHKSTLSDWKTGRSMPSIDKICAIADCFGVDVDYFSEYGTDNKYDLLKDNFFIIACNVNQNRRALERVPHEIHEDIALTYYYGLDDISHISNCVLITYHHLRSWGIDAQTLHDDAWKSMKKTRSARLGHITEYLNEITSCVDISEEIKGEMTSSTFQAYQLSNKYFYYGSVYMFDYEIMQQASKILKGNLIVLPFSVNLVFLMRARLGEDYQEEKESYAAISRTAMKEADYLSDNIYRYDADSGVLSKI